jgi:hypothetical protein
MTSPGKVVTLASMKPPQAQAESREDLDLMNSPKGKLAVARYSQIMQRLRQETTAVDPDVMITVPDREVSLAQSKLAMDGTPARRLDSGGQEVKFGAGLKGGDWFRWLLSLNDWVDRKDAHVMPRPTSAQAATLANDSRVAIVGDWGTGLYGAPKIAASIRRMSEARPFDLLMHLGDVYYSGTKEEVQERFLAAWPTEAGKVSRALNSNHEMYSGGFGYFDLTLPKFQQEFSYFALQNQHWLLVGLDTAYVDHDIDNEQVAWLSLLVSNSTSDSRTQPKLVLFSHQQPFSMLDDQGPKLQRALKHLLESKTITAWYWGHEHQCVIYDRHEAWGLLGRCLGNGGIPEPRKSRVQDAPADGQYPGDAGCTWRRLSATGESPACIVLDGPNMDMEKPAHQNRFVPHGFMTLEFSGPDLTERVFLSDGTQLWVNTIR